MKRSQTNPGARPSAAGVRCNTIRYGRSLAGVLLCCAAMAATAETALVAVASNFAETARTLVALFTENSAHRLTLTPGSTGKLYAQILHGAPYDLFLAADAERPRLLEESGAAVAGSRQTYAIGQLVLHENSQLSGLLPGRELLVEGNFSRLALANPQLAPYGLAALETLQSLGVEDTVQGKLVYGDNVGQVYAMLNTGNVDLAFISAAQLSVAGGHRGRSWRVPEELHRPIRQDLVMLSRARGNPAAEAFTQFLRTRKARALIVSLGYRPFDD